MSSCLTYVSNARYITHHYDDTHGVCAYLLVHIRVVFNYFHFSVSVVLSVTFPVAVDKISESK